MKSMELMFRGDLRVNPRKENYKDNDLNSHYYAINYNLINDYLQKLRQHTISLNYEKG